MKKIFATGTVILFLLMTGSWAATGSRPTITTNKELPDARVGSSYSCTLSATGTEPITWSLYTRSLPRGLELSKNGVISGTPSKLAEGRREFTVIARNDVGIDMKVLSIYVKQSTFDDVHDVLSLASGGGCNGLGLGVLGFAVVGGVLMVRRWRKR